MNAPVTVVIVTYNSRGEIDAALEGARRCVDAGLCDYLVVDNASPDGTESHVRERHPWVRCVQSGGNIGYGRACNLGAAGAGTPYLLFQNADAVVGPDAISRLVQFMDERPAVGITGPAIITGDHHLQHAGGLLRPGTLIAIAAGRRPRGYARRDIQPGEAPFRTDHICGAAFMIRRALFEALGGFDPRFFLYFDETDLCLRAAQRGAELWAVGEAVAAHAGNRSAKSTGDALVAGCIAEHYYRSRFYYMVKHFGWLRATAAESAELTLNAVRLAKHAVLRRSLEGVLERYRAPMFRLPARPMASK